MGGFNPNDYETVESRIRKFYEDHKDGRITTTLEVRNEDKWFVVKAYAYRDHDTSVPIATGYAEEHVTQRGVNATSALENCETSAIGRALANANYAAKARPTREEMRKVERLAPPASEPTRGAASALAKAEANGKAAMARSELSRICEENKYDRKVVAARFKQKYGMSLSECFDADKLNEFIGALTTAPEVVLGEK
jgi:hypothetical protein